MATVIACPFCQRSLSLPDEALARAVRCPGCNGEFDTARSASGVPVTPRPQLVIETAEVLPPPLRGVPPPPGQLRPVLVSSTHDEGPTPGRHDDLPDGLERCANCRARVTRELAVCPACGRALRGDEERPWEQAGGPLRRDCEPHRGPLLVSLGRLALCLSAPGLLAVAYFPFGLASVLAIGLGLTVSVLARDDLEQMRRKEMDPEGEASTISGQTAGSIGLIIGIVGLLLAGLLRLPLLFR